MFNYRARPNDTHVSGQNIQKLRKLIKAQFSHDCPNGCHARVSAQFPGAFPLETRCEIALQMLLQDRIAINLHRAEFKCLTRKFLNRSNTLQFCG
ncbi:hypothetical protein ADT71_00110 [Novosphingobium sp. ST904]|nr:hypothetical protein ADT71_00110 [Novosphingobium sp. ST904]